MLALEKFVLVKCNAAPLADHMNTAEYCDEAPALVD